MITADEQRTVDADDDQTNDGDMPTALSGHNITLQTQHNDPLLARMIDCLQRGELPTDDNTASRVLLTKDHSSYETISYCILALNDRKTTKRTNR